MGPFPTKRPQSGEGTTHEVRSQATKMDVGAWRGGSEVYRRTTAQEEETIYLKRQYGGGGGGGGGG